MARQPRASAAILRPSQTRCTDPVSAYARAVARREIPAGRLVRLACLRHLLDLRRAPSRGLVWRPEAAVYGIRFFGFLRHTKGEFSNRPFGLAPWQQFIVGSLHGWKRADGTRRFRVAYVEVPRKNGKSAMLAGVGLQMLVADGEPGAEVYAVATKREQARIVFDEARRMASRSPELRRLVQRFRHNLSVDQTASKFEPLSSDDKTLDGLNPSCVVVDEYHRHRTRAVFDVMDTSVGARRQPLIAVITTAGDDTPGTPYAQEHDYAVRLLEGAAQDDATFAFIACADIGDPWDEPATWAKANPNYGVSVKPDDLARQAAKAKASPAALSAFRRLRLGIRTSDHERVIDVVKWMRCTKGPITAEMTLGRRCFAGADLSSKLALSAVAMLFPPDGKHDRWMLAVRHWLPADTLDAMSDRDGAEYRRWLRDGWIEATPGDVIDHGAIEDHLVQAAAAHDIAAVAYDPWNATQLATRLFNEHGLPMKEFRQGTKSYNAPFKEMLALVQAGAIEHGGNPVMGWQAANLRAYRDRNDNIMPDKKTSAGRIDGFSAAIMALGAAMGDAAWAASPWETDGFAIEAI